MKYIINISNINEIMWRDGNNINENIMIMSGI